MTPVAVAIVRVWTRIYTAGLPPALRTERRAEIESDLWEGLHNPPAAGGSSGLQVIQRLIAGIPDDLAWRVELTTRAAAVRQESVMMTSLFESKFAGTPKGHGATVFSRAAGAAMFLSLAALLGVDSRRPFPVRPLANLSSAVEAQAGATTSEPGAGASGPSEVRSSSELSAGIAATVMPYLIRARPGDRPRSAAGVPWHTEKHRVNVFILDLARTDRLTGPYLMRSPVSCETDETSCGKKTTPGMFTVKNATIPELADYLADELGGVVIDRTGILGRFDATLRWSPRRAERATIFNALREQLGLKLDVTTQETDVLVADRMQVR